MTQKNITLAICAVLAVVVLGYLFLSKSDIPTPFQGKININEVCEGAVAYMTFPDAASAEVFVAECKNGQHPDVIERYKAQMNLDGATI